MRATSVVEAVVAAAVCFFVVSRCDRRAERRRAEETPPPAEMMQEEDLLSGGSPDCEEFVQRFLHEHGFRLGFNRDKGMFVAIGVGLSECPASSPDGLSDAREKSLKEALSLAKASIERNLTLSFSDDELRKLEHAGSKSSSDNGSDGLPGFDFSMTLGGFSRLAQSEGWNPDESRNDDSSPGLYTVAVAVAWKQSSHERIVAESEAGAESGIRVSEKEFDAWLAEQNREMLIGPQTVKDADGRFHYLGIGVADGEGRRVRERAERSARSFAVFPLLSKVGESMVSKTRIGSGDDEIAEDLEIVYTDELVNEGHVRFVALDDFTSVNPVSGRKQTSVVVEAFP